MRLSRIQSIFQKRALVLMYHRIHSPVTDPWDLSVSPENFEEHLQSLKRSYSIISADELAQQLISGTLKNRSVVLTFDDGYRDNFEIAKPLLEKYSVPATFFITDSYLGLRQSFWWDELEQIIVHSRNLPQVFTLDHPNQTIRFELENEEVLNDELKAKQTDFKYDRPPTRRTELYLKLWEILSPLRKDEQIRLLQQIRKWAGFTEADIKVAGCMTEKEVLQLSENPLFTIGGHTKTHPALSSRSKEIQHKEIIENQLFLERLTKQKILHFSYPSGDFDESTIQILNDSSFTVAYTTSGKPVLKNTDLYKISRFQVKNWYRRDFENSINRCFKL